MSHQIALAFEDGVTRFVTCEDRQTVADASYRARINIPLDCRDGACGTCKAMCVSGDFDGGSYIDDALTDEEAAQGFCLPCSMTPRSDLVLQIASTSAVAKARVTSHETTVTAVDRLSPTTVRLSVAAPSATPSLAFLPGQYVNLTVPGAEETRSYSFSSVSGSDQHDFLIKLTPGGLMSTWLEQSAAVGDEITFTGPHGSFFLREAERPALLLAGGTGLAPIMSILRRLAEEGSERQAHLIYGVSTDEDLVELETISELADQLPGLTWDHCVADAASSAEHKGYVTDLIQEEHLHDGEVAVYLCGPPPMVEAAREHFASQGVTPTGFYFEKFTPGASAAATPAETEVAQTGGEPEVSQAPSSNGAEPGAQTPAVDEPSEQIQAPPVEAARAPEPAGDDRILETAGAAARAIAGQLVLPEAELAPLEPGLTADSSGSDAATRRRIAGQTVMEGHLVGDVLELERPAALVLAEGARAVAGQEIWPAHALDPLVAAAPQSTPDDSLPDSSSNSTYEIGEEHPGVHESDSIFEARRALELGALELVLGRLSAQQLSGYRLLAELTLPYVEGERFVDAAAYTETNAAFHDYLFTQTGNEHLLLAYQALGVEAQMAETLQNATWCDARCATDHVEIVDAIEAEDRELARRLISEHAERSKATMRRAMEDSARSRRPAFVTPGRFAGKVVIVTGAAQGIGEATARRIAAEGGLLALVDRSPHVQETAADLTNDGAQAVAICADVEQWGGAAQVAEATLARFGRVDVLVNNVGGAINFKPFAEFTEQEIRAEVDRSLITTLLTCRAVVPKMIERGHGVIVNVSSAATRGVHRVPYSAAKGGVNATTAALAMELAPHGIRVVATAPGGTDAPARRVSRGTPEPTTDAERSWFQEHIDQTLASSLLHRYGTLDEQAAAICFLASDEASYITGTVLPVAGGDLG